MLLVRARGFVALLYVILKFLRLNLLLWVNLLIRFICSEFTFSELVRIIFQGFSTFQEQ